MSSSSAGGKGKKKSASAFQAAARGKGQSAALLQNLLAGADEVAERSFLGGGSALAPAPVKPGAPDAAEAATPVPPQSRDETEAPEAASSPASSPASPETRNGSRPEAAEEPASGNPFSSSDLPVSAKKTGPRTRRSTKSPSEPSAPSTTTAKSSTVVDPSPADALPETPGSDEPALSASALAPSSRRRSKSTRGPWAHTAVHESFAEAKIRSEEWEQHGFRIEPEVLAALKARIAQDRRSSGNGGLAFGHYLDAALRHTPTNVDEQIAWAQQFLDDRMAYVEKGKQSTYRVGRQAHALMSSLHQELQEADYGRRGLYVISAALERLLQALNAEGELQRPERRNPVGEASTA
ncbi:hypothetical protein ACFQ2B_38535 [Streptomyces stramineus]|uniref:Uncharacterized protein n=1 Tax=Streptomyces stramineus TaxID=173861 RepID=A0ABP3JYJ4_9ACTN